MLQVINIIIGICERSDVFFFSFFFFHVCIYFRNLYGMVKIPVVCIPNNAKNIVNFRSMQ